MNSINSLMYPQDSMMFTSLPTPKELHIYTLHQETPTIEKNKHLKTKTKHHSFWKFVILGLIIQWQRTYSWSPSHWDTGKHRIRRLRCQGRRRGGTEGGSHTSDQRMKAPKLVTCGEHIVGDQLGNGITTLFHLRKTEGESWWGKFPKRNKT